MPKKHLPTTTLNGNYESNLPFRRDTIHNTDLPSENEDFIPVPIQIFLWRQSSPFIKQKFGNLTDASAIIFDRVLVQNILHGLSPSLTDAISSIPRWLLKKAAFPHVMHACSSVMKQNLPLIEQQQQQHSFPTSHSSLLVTTPSSHSPTVSTQIQIPSHLQLPTSLNSAMSSIENQLNQSYSPCRSSAIVNHSLSPIEIRLFHTLNCLILESSESKSQPCSLNAIQLFIYLFFPYIHTYLQGNKREFLSNPDLAQGMRIIWQPLFEYCQPDIRLFNALVKPVLITNNHREQRFSSDNNNQLNRSSTLIHSSIQRSSTEMQFSCDLKKQYSLDQPNIYSEASNTNYFQSKVNIQEKQNLNTIIRNASVTTTICQSIIDFSNYEIANNNQTSLAPIVHMESICSISNASQPTISPQTTVPNTSHINFGMPKSLSAPSMHLHFPSTRQPPNISNADVNNIISSPKTRSPEYLLFATYFDIGIIRTLFNPSWLTDGYLWCLEYLNKRMINISDEMLSDSLTNGILPINNLRIKSLSMPQINTINENNFFSYLKQNYLNEQTTHNIIEQQSMTTSPPNSINKPTKLLNVQCKFSSEKISYNKNYTQKCDNLYKKASKMCYIDDDRIEHLDLADTDRHRNFRKLSSTSSPHSGCFRFTGPNVLLFKTSILNNIDPVGQSANFESTVQKLTVSKSTTNLTAMKLGSVSDSAINYNFLAEPEEAQGLNGYINRNGTVNFGVILAGIHAVICKEHHFKVCELVMNILDVLFGLTVISSTEDEAYKKQLSNNGNKYIKTTFELTQEHIEKWLKQIDTIEDEKFQLALDIILRILKRLGCSNCQPRGRSFLLDQLHGKARVLLNKLRLLHHERFAKFFLHFTLTADLAHVLDILHAFCSYCSASTIGLAHYAPYLTTNHDVKSPQTYSNNFANTHLGTGLKGVDGFIFNIIFKPLVTRINQMEEHLLIPDNVKLYSECRAFLTYVKEHHGGIFRSVAFSSLIDAEKKITILRNLIKEKSTHQNDNKLRRSPDNNLVKNVYGSIDQELQKQSAIAEQSPVINRSQPITESLTEGDDHSLYEHQKQSLYVDLTCVRMGLLRLHCLLQSSPPGSLPDPQFLHNLLVLDAPIISKAAFLIECAHFVRCCSLGQWPVSMRINTATFRSHETHTGRTNGSINVRANKIYQAAAGRMFYIWGDALSSQLESILNIELQQNLSTNLWNKDEIFEDYYNEAIVNRSGHDCPHALKLLVCLLLYEITSFLRETYETLPKLSSLRIEAANCRQQRTNNTQHSTDVPSNIMDKHSTGRLRMDSLGSQISNRSTISLISEKQPFSPQMLSTATINMNPLARERHISFAIPKEHDSNESNHTAILMNDDDSGVGAADGYSTSVFTAAHKRKSIAGIPMKSKLSRRNSTKLTKLPVRMKDVGKSTHRSSFRARRRSHISNTTTDNDVHQNMTTECSTTEATIEHPASADDELELEKFDNFINTRPMPWMNVVIKIFNNVNLTCNHQLKCLSTCYEKQAKSCRNILVALLNMYQSSSSSTFYSRSSSMQTNLKCTDAGANTARRVGSLMQIPLMILCKSSVLLEDEHYSQILPLSWELLLDRNEELSSCAATIVILTAARAHTLVEELIHKEMENASPLVRYNAILKFQILWRFRHQLWVRLENDAHSTMKILPPSIEFVLPSPTLGLANLQTVDPPWMPHVKTLVQQVAINQEEVRAVVTTSKTRKRHQQELIHSALMTEDISKRVARENFAISIVPMLEGASFEPLLNLSEDEEDEAHTDDDRIMDTSIQLCEAQGTLPSVFGAAIFHLVDMLEDEEVINNGAIVSGAARKVLWNCLLDEPTLFIRFFFEKISQKERRIKSLQSLHHLMIYFTDIPPQFAHAIFNYVLGLLSSMVRSPLDGSQELIVNGLTLLWQIVPYLHGLVLKDLKQILRKEQAEMLILVTGNMPSTKKVIIHGPDMSQIPTQAIISEDTQFSSVLQEALEFFGIPSSKREQYYLIDVKTQLIHIPDTYVRDFYFFRRNIYPQLSLVYMDGKKSQQGLERMAIFLKTTELSKVLFARYLLETMPFNQINNCITFFHDELIKSPLFPRKSLESDFNLYTTIHNKEVFNLDMLHKYNWIKLITCIFFNMDDKITTTTTSDISLFISVINGSFILHCEDLLMLRFCLATYINIVKHFRHIFAANGYLLIMPTFLCVYSNIQSNPMLKKAIEYCCRQFFILHRIPFILQMLGSISQLFDFNQSTDNTHTNGVQSTSLFRLLIALEQTNFDSMTDDYSILELIKNDSSTSKTHDTTAGNMNTVAALGQRAMFVPRVIKSLDFCYADDDTIFTLLNCFDVCVTVDVEQVFRVGKFAYAPNSLRSLQMLNIIDMLLPKYLQHIKDYTNKNDIHKCGLNEIKKLEKLSITMKTLIHSSEWLTRTFTEPKSDASADVTYRYSRNSYLSPSILADEESTNRFIDERAKSKIQDVDELEQASEFRWPRDIILAIISTFIHFSIQRSNELIKLLRDSTIHLPELLDTKSHTRLADIAHTLLKLSSFDPITVGCRGVQNYFQKLLPYTDWSDEQLRPVLNNILRRIDRMFVKVCKKSTTKHSFDWEATAGILNGIYLTVDRHPYIAYFPNFKILISGCITLILNENQIDVGRSVPRTTIHIFPKELSRSVIKLVGRYLLAIKHQPNLEALTSNNSWSSLNTSSAIDYLLHFFLPLLFWMSSEQKDGQKLHPMDISYIITVLLSSVKPPLKPATTIGTQNISMASIVNAGKQHLILGEATLASNTFSHKPIGQLKYLAQTVSLLGLKIVIVSFSKQIRNESQRIIEAIKAICNKQAHISSNLLSFIDFIVSYETPIYVILRPFLCYYMNSMTSKNDSDYEIIRSIQQKLSFDKIVPSKSMAEILNELTQEWNQLNEELADESKIFDVHHKRATSTDKMHLSADVCQQMKNNDGTRTRMNIIHNQGSTARSQTTNTIYLEGQEQSDSSLDSSVKNRTEKIQVADALNILEAYYIRYRTRCGVSDTTNNRKEYSTLRDLSFMKVKTAASVPNNHLDVQSISKLRPQTAFSRSLITTSGHSGSTMNRSFKYYNQMGDNNASHEHSIGNETSPKLRTFHGLKRNMACLDKSRSTRSSRQFKTTNELSMKYDATEEMNVIFRPNRYVNQQSIDSSNIHPSSDQTSLNPFAHSTTNPTNDQTSNSSSR
ncbi:unnamed protein product [Rotaria socialis]|uniref:Uncharacterized protein n=1 Tax=Rotaria socialis TaxID=392032 RepID=A0A820PZG1_9BILA|nr:unnamed protein product [Rotaria socialis]